MDFNYTEEQQMLRDSIGKYLEKSYDFDTRQKLVRSDAAWSEEAWQQFADFGLLALPFNEEQGGLGGSISDCVAFAELFGKHLVIEPYLAAVMLGGAALAASGAAAQELFAKVIGGEAVVAFAFDARVLGADASEHAAFGVAGEGVGADGGCEDAEVVAVVEDADLDAVVLLAIDAVGFATDVEVDAGGGHEVAFVGGVEEHFTGVGFAVEGGDGGDAGAVFFDASGAVEEGFADDWDVEFFDPVVINAFGDVGFEDPGALGGVVDGGGGGGRLLDSSRT
jgi:hypothetical protein